ncbi:Unannotated [Lentimonas sp. CC4]|nr:Unannotated [Lentimonas sp. CC4]CAA6687414.1 Unannotated [Lentimonas sp. CC6]CAA7076069.1 Unannotated [Lentimonas sp. CC4]CAA7172130.1 Unannotated [Lentimonas sp. CC21]CAA7181119.1 Unannotated [Lentimonas sp. CC8]
MTEAGVGLQFWAELEAVATPLTAILQQSLVWDTWLPLRSMRASAIASLLS